MSGGERVYRLTHLPTGEVQEFRARSFDDVRMAASDRLVHSEREALLWQIYMGNLTARLDNLWELRIVEWSSNA